MPFIVRNTRVDWATKTIARIVPLLAEDVVLEAAEEVGLFDCLSYNERGDGFKFDLTDLQAVALAATLACVAETT